MCISAVLGVASSLVGASSAKKAGKAAAEAGRQQLALQERIYDEQTENFQPYLEGGRIFNDAYLYEMGLGAAPTIGGRAPDVVEFNDVIPADPNAVSPFFVRPENRDPNVNYDPQPQNVTKYRVNDQVFGSREAAQAYADANPEGTSPYSGFTKTPGYDFRLGQGYDAIESSAAGRGGLYSGATMRRLQEYGQDYASNEYNNFLNRLASGAGAGQAAAGNQAAAGQNFAAGGANALANIGNAQAASAIGVGNAWQGGIGNLASIYGSQVGQSDDNRLRLFG